MAKAHHHHNRHAPLWDRFWSRVAKQGEDGCWLWTGLLSASGYGRFCPQGDGYVLAHRFIYEQTIGPMPEDRELHHTCEEKRCVNPAHLRAVTRWEHSVMLTPQNITAKNAAKTHCAHGHELTESNTYRAPKLPRRRICRICRDTRQKQIRERRKQKEAANSSLLAACALAHAALDAATSTLAGMDPLPGSRLDDLCGELAAAREACGVALGRAEGGTE